MVSKDITLKYFTNLHVQQNSDNWSNKLTFLDNYNLERIHNWYSHQQDITSYFPTNPQVRQANLSTIESKILHRPRLTYFGIQMTQQF